MPPTNYVAADGLSSGRLIHKCESEGARGEGAVSRGNGKLDVFHAPNIRVRHPAVDPPNPRRDARRRRHHRPPRMPPGEEGGEKLTASKLLNQSGVGSLQTLSTGELLPHLGRGLSRSRVTCAWFTKPSPRRYEPGVLLIGERGGGGREGSGRWKGAATFTIIAAATDWVLRGAAADVKRAEAKPVLGRRFACIRRCVRA